MREINLKNKVILITGFTGSLGTALVDRLLKTKVKEIRGYSRDEFKQSEMARKIKDKRLTYWLGDIRDLTRLQEACTGVDIIIHTAAHKRMDQISHNAYDVADVNINGTRNVVLAGKNCERIVFISTDKAYHAENLYGATKMVAEGIALATPNCIVWRFGNFIGSRGSVWKIFEEQKNNNIPLTITDLNATRFVIELDEVCDYVLSNVKPGLHYPPNLKTMTVLEIANEISPHGIYDIVGLRPGEKMFEEFNENYNSKKNA